MASFPGLYRAVVQENSTTTLTLVVPQLFGTAQILARPCLPPGWAGALPALNSLVWVAFEGGEARYPVWLGVVSA